MLPDAGRACADKVIIAAIAATKANREVEFISSKAGLGEVGRCSKYAVGQIVTRLQR